MEFVCLPQLDTFSFVSQYICGNVSAGDKFKLVGLEPRDEHASS